MYIVRFYKKSKPHEPISEQFTLKDQAQRWAALVKRNGYIVKEITE
jgi:hypothetical protein